MNFRVLKLLAAALLLQACAVDVIESTEELENQEGEDFLECCFDTPESMVSLSPRNLPVWDSEDVISILSTTGKNKMFALVSGVGTATGIFRGNFPTGNSLYGMYSDVDDRSECRQYYSRFQMG